MAAFAGKAKHHQNHETTRKIHTIWERYSIDNIKIILMHKLTDFDACIKPRFYAV